MLMHCPYHSIYVYCTCIYMLVHAHVRHPCFKVLYMYTYIDVHVHVYMHHHEVLSISFHTCTYTCVLPSYPYMVGT